MDVKDLRIGNQVMVNPYIQELGGVQTTRESMEICAVKGIIELPDGTVVIVQTSTQIEVVGIEHISGIPLTDEILERSGLVKARDRGKTSFFLMDKYCILPKWGVGRYTGIKRAMYGQGYHATYVGDVKYLHEVQNAAYFLCKKELKIKLNINIREAPDKIKLQIDELFKALGLKIISKEEGS